MRKSPLGQDCSGSDEFVSLVEDDHGSVILSTGDEGPVVHDADVGNVALKGQVQPMSNIGSFIILDN